MGVKIDTDEINLTKEEKLFDINNKEIGFLRSAVFSPTFKKVVGIAMINKKFWNMKGKFKIKIHGDNKQGVTCKLPIV